MKRATMLARHRAGRYLNSPPRPEREWPVALLIIGAGLAILAAVIGIALEAGK